MAIDKKNLTNVDNTNPTAYPNGHTVDNTGANDGTELNNALLSDKFETFDKLMRLYDIPFNGSLDNETNGFQYVEALRALASKNDFVLDITEDSGDLVIPIKLGQLQDNESVILKATVDKTTETDLKGSLDSVTKTITYLGDFKTGEYVRMINLTSSVILIRMVDADSIIGAKSSNFLASASRNGLLSKDDFISAGSIVTKGLVNDDGTIDQGTGFTVVSSEDGRYVITHNFGAPTIPIITPHIGSIRSLTIDAVTNNSFQVKLFDTGGALLESKFSFLLLKP